MTENEKRLREWIRMTAGGPLCHEMAEQAQSTVLSAARDAALEEAANVATSAEAKTPGMRVGLHVVAGRIRALKSQPARRFLDAERVREVRDELLEVAEEVAATDPENPVGLIRSTVAEFAARLGLDLAAAPASDVPRATRETATVENGLLPAPRKLGVCRQCNAPTSKPDGFCSDTCETEWNVEISAPTPAPSCVACRGRHKFSEPCGQPSKAPAPRKSRAKR